MCAVAFWFYSQRRLVESCDGDRRRRVQIRKFAHLIVRWGSLGPQWQGSSTLPGSAAMLVLEPIFEARILRGEKLKQFAFRGLCRSDRQGAPRARRPVVRAMVARPSPPPPRPRASAGGAP